MVEVARRRHRPWLWVLTAVAVLALAIPFGPRIARSVSESKPFPIDLRTVGTPCPDDRAWVCGAIDVPFDRAATSSETLTVKFRILPRRLAAAPSAGTIVVVNGGPGNPSMRQYAWAQDAFRSARRDHDLLLVDNRGSGASGRIDCPEAEKQFSHQAVMQCRKILGVHANHYGTVAAVDDLEAVLQRIHANDVDLYGESYGTFFAQVFALRHPEHLRRLVLDGALPLDTDPWRRASLPAGLAALRNTCRAHPDCVDRGDTKALVAKTVAAVRVDPRNAYPAAGAEDLALLLANAGRAGSAYREFPAAARAYLADDAAPLFRILNEATQGGFGNASDDTRKDSAGLLAAGICGDEPQPFDLRATLAAQKRQLAQAYTAARASIDNKVGPFTPAEALRRDGTLCLGWPAPTGVTPQALGHNFPKVPTLVLEGALDTVTPPVSARSVARQFRGSRYIEVPWIGHIAALSDTTGCAAGIAAEFLAARDIDTACLKRLVPPLVIDAFPQTYAQQTPIDVSGYRGAALTVDDRRTIAVARDTVSDVLWRWGRLGFDHGRGLRGGTFRTYILLTPGDFQVHLDSMRWTTDTAVSGVITSDTTEGSIDGSIVVRTPSGRAHFNIRSAHVLGPSAVETINGSVGGHDIRIEVDAKLGL